jgi:methylmalonyl-CoA mutase C-terminal domain/subunit
MVQDKKIRVIVAKPGLDGHDRGAKVVARALRDAGMEVIYTGLHQTPAQIVETVIQEDPDVLCLSILSGAHNELLPRVVQTMKAKGMDDVLVMAGGVIPDDDVEALKAHGIEGFYGPGARLQDIIDYIKTHLKR